MLGVVCLLTLGGLHPARGGEPWKLAGRVLDGDRKSVGMAGVEVTAYPDNSPNSQPLTDSTLTGSDGAFKLECEPKGSLVVVRYKKTGHQITLPAVVVHDPASGGHLPDAVCRRAASATGLTAFTMDEIIGILAERQRGLSATDASARSRDDLQILHDQNLDPARIKALEANSVFK